MIKKSQFCADSMSKYAFVVRKIFDRSPDIAFDAGYLISEHFGDHLSCKSYNLDSFP